MEIQSPDRTGMLIVRLWIEAHHERGLRARITQTLDATATEQSVAVASSAEDICAVVKGWVDDFAGPGSDAHVRNVPANSPGEGSA
jgi:hypothetical protein